MVSIIKIAGIPIEINSTIPYKNKKKINTFLSKDQEQVELKLFLNYNNNLIPPEDSLVLDDMVYWSKRKHDSDDTSIAIYDLESNQVTYHLQVNNRWNNAVINYRKSKRDILFPLFETLGEILFRNCLLFHQGMVIHAAAIECSGKGIIFSAPSGTGKTTQANLWRKHKGAKIINADRPAVRVIGNESYVYGTLWNGSSKKCSNQSVPLSAIVLLEQSEDNVIHKLEKKEAIEKLMPRCFLPFYQEDLMSLALNNIEQIINQTPVYLLKCRPDREAVELVYQCVK